MKTIDKTCFQKLTNDCYATANPHVLAIRHLRSQLWRISRSAAEEVENSATSHLYGGARGMGENEDRNVEGQS